MQPSRMFNSSAMSQADLLREVSAMRLAEQALQFTEPRARRFSPVGSLAFTITNWRRLSARRLVRAGREVAATSQPQRV